MELNNNSNENQGIFYHNLIGILRKLQKVKTHLDLLSSMASKRRMHTRFNGQCIIPFLKNIKVIDTKSDEEIMVVSRRAKERLLTTIMRFYAKRIQDILLTQV
jgi:hypothetical protein